jgi:hypothetical protein
METDKASGLGRLLIAVYGVFAISATARASFQLATEFDQAPLAYSLSAVSAVIYVFATLALARKGEFWSRMAFWTISFELVGVVVVGVLSLVIPEYFSHPSVWSDFGQGYGFVPLVLPILGLLWLKRTAGALNG